MSVGSYILSQLSWQTMAIQITAPHLGPYEIVSAIGAAALGEVYPRRFVFMAAQSFCVLRTEFKEREKPWLR